MIDVDIAYPNADKVAVGGTCSLGARVTVRLRNAASVRGQTIYQTPLIEALTLTDAPNLSGWTVTGDLPNGYRATLYVADQKVWLRFSLQGFLMWVK